MKSLVEYFFSLDFLNERSKIPLDVQADLQKLITILTQLEGTPVQKVKLFGSITGKKWNALRSDIDIAIILNTQDQNYSCFERTIVGYKSDGEGYGEIPIYGETAPRVMLRKKILANPQLKFARKYHLLIITLTDLEIMKAGKSPAHLMPLFYDKSTRPDIELIRATEKGIELFPNNNLKF